MRHAWIATLLASAAIIGMSACGGTEAGREGGSGPDAAATTAEIENACAGGCSFERRCQDDSETAEACIAVCLQDKFGSVARKMRADITRAWGNCLANLECTGRDDDCEPVALRAAGIDPETVRDLPDARTCLDRYDSCPGMDDIFALFCTFQFFLTTSARSEVMACLDAPCEDIYDCMSLAIYGPNSR